MIEKKTLLGQFMILREKNPDTWADPYDPLRESPLELDLPNHSLVFSQPSTLPSPPPVILSIPGALPHPPNVTLESPTNLPPPPSVTLGSPSILPLEPAPPNSIPGALPPPPAVVLSNPQLLPPPPATTTSTPLPLPPPPTTTASTPSLLPAPPQVKISSAARALPPVPAVTLGSPSILPDPPTASVSQPLELPEPQEVKVQAPRQVDANVAVPEATPDSGYALLGQTYSPILGAADPGSMASDPILYERQLERVARLGAGKMTLHAITQVGLFAQNVYGTVWNPALAIPPPGTADFLLPALDLGGVKVLGQDGKTEDLQIQLNEMIESTYDKSKQNNSNKQLTPASANDTSGQPTVSTLNTRVSISRGLSQAFDNAANNISNIVKNGLVAAKPTKDRIKEAGVAFTNGIIPMKLKGDNKFGFRTFKKGAGDDKISDDDVYVPLCFTDLRPVGDVYRTIYFRPIITSLGESLSPEWNKSQFMGRVDPVATYQSTTRTISLGFKLIAFGPEDVKTIYQKLNWLSSMVYPEYGNNMTYRSGPVVRMRIGDLVNSIGPEGAKGLPGIIESLEFDYTDKLWELKTDYKLPREVDVSLNFTVIHDVPIGRGIEGKFGGLGRIDKEGVYTITESKDASGMSSTVNSNFRNFGKSVDIKYSTLIDADEKIKG